MIFIYKLGGDWNKDGIDYTVKTVSHKEINAHLNNGWFKSFNQLASKNKKSQKKAKKDDGKD